MIGHQRSSLQEEGGLEVLTVHNEKIIRHQNHKKILETRVNNVTSVAWGFGHGVLHCTTPDSLGQTNSMLFYCLEFVLLNL